MSTRQETAEERRQRLVGVARDLIADEGVAACTFRRLARRAGTSTRPFTHAFGTRDQLLREVALSTWSGSPLDVVEAPVVVERDDGWDPIDELVRVGEHWLPLSTERSRDERIYLEIILYCMNRPALREELLGFSMVANERIRLVLEEGCRRGLVRDDLRVDELVMAYWGYHAGLGLTGIYEAEVLPPAMIRRIWRAGLASLLAPR